LIERVNIVWKLSSVKVIYSFVFSWFRSLADDLNNKSLIISAHPKLRARGATSVNFVTIGFKPPPARAGVYEITDGIIIIG